MRVAIVTPVFNDWTSLSKLISAIDAIGDQQEARFSLFVVDDGSSEPMVISSPLHSLHHIVEIEIIGLTCNLGHQRAIAVGLVDVFSRGKFDEILVMDSDGEDRPADIVRLLAEAARLPGHIICARREHRPAVLSRLWYRCYKSLFWLLTGAQIDFGNFCLIPGEKLEAVVSNSSIWNNLAASLSRSRIPLARVPTDRGIRYADESKMDFVSLVMHGLSAMAVYSDVIMVRLMLSTLALSVATIIGIMVVVAIRFFTDLAIPGWASSVAGVLTIILLQGIMLFTISAFTVLNTRSIQVVVPRVDAPSFKLFRRQIFPVTVVEAAK